jgi:hypothetical protein
VAVAPPESATTDQRCYYYEVELVTDGVIQLGWADASRFPPSATSGSGLGLQDGDGVGDVAGSWAYDGAKGVKWDGDAAAATAAAAEAKEETHEQAYGELNTGDGWQEGDVVGCAITFTHEKERGRGKAASTAAGAASVSIEYYVNGSSLGKAFEFKCGHDAVFYPAISMEAGEIIRINVGKRGFAYGPAVAADSGGGRRAHSAASPSFVAIYEARVTKGVVAVEPATSAAPKRPATQLATSQTPAVPISERTPDSAVAENAAAEPIAAPPQPQRPSFKGPIDLDAVSTPADLTELGVDMDLLKAELTDRGLKAG